MIGPQVQKAIVDALKAAGIAIHDRVPEKATFPYATIGSEQTVDDGNSCGDGWLVFADVHVWSRVPGKVEAKTLSASVATAVLATTDVAGFALDDVRLESRSTFDDPDGLTAHTVMTFRFTLDEA